MHREKESEAGYINKYSYLSATMWLLNNLDTRCTCFYVSGKTGLICYSIFMKKCTCI